MPFKSKAQQRFFFAAESRGEFPKGTALEWAHATKDIKKLPEKIRPKEEPMKETTRQKAADDSKSTLGRDIGGFAGGVGGWLGGDYIGTQAAKKILEPHLAELNYRPVRNAVRTAVPKLKPGTIGRALFALLSPIALGTWAGTRAGQGMGADIHSLFQAKKAASCSDDGGRGKLHKPGPEAIRKMAFRVLAEASQRLPEKSAQVCRQLALSLGHGSSLQDALASCRLPVESRVKVARFVFSAVKQAASEDSESFSARLGEGLGKSVGSVAGFLGGGAVGSVLGSGPLRGPHRLKRHLLHFGARPMSQWNPKVVRRAGLALLGPLLGYTAGMGLGGHIGKQLGTEAAQLPRLLPSRSTGQ